MLPTSSGYKVEVAYSSESFVSLYHIVLYHTSKESLFHTFAMLWDLKNLQG